MIHKLLLVILSITFLSAGAQTKTTKMEPDQIRFKSQIKKADSLANLNQFNEALAIYNDQIEAILSGRIQVTVSAKDWKRILYSAAEAGRNGKNYQMASRYANMAFGAHGEKINEKIDFLKQMGVKLYYTYQAYETGNIRVVTDWCNSKQTKYLVWLHGDGCFVQAFDECDTYKPVKFIDTAIPSMLHGSFEALLSEKINRLRVGNSHEMHYNFIFPDDGEQIDRRFKIGDVSVYGQNSPQYKTVVEDRQVEKYNQNMNSKLRRLNTLSFALIEKYEAIINSPAEREKVGKI